MLLQSPLELLESLEWSGEQYYSDDMDWLPICPICRGHKPLGDEDDEKYRGHKKSREFANMLQELKEQLGDDNG